MDLVKQIAEILANAFVWLCVPLRHHDWAFQRGEDSVVVTVAIEKNQQKKNIVGEMVWPVSNDVSESDWIDERLASVTGQRSSRHAD